ncbi:MAG: hypothetical protein ABI594_17850 [Ginsengibacter sp.]
MIDKESNKITEVEKLISSNLFVSDFYHIKHWAYDFIADQTNREPFNSAGTEYSPKISPDNKYFFFSSTRTKTISSHKTNEDYNHLLKRIYNAGNGLGDIYQVDIKQLPLLINN